MEPQQSTRESLRMAQVWEEPADTDKYADVSFMSVGFFFGVVVPSPSWPAPLSPQQSTRESLARMAQAWSPPIDIAANGAVLFMIVGLYLLDVVPSPSWPYWFMPQQSTRESLVRMAQVLEPPASIEVNGTALLVSVATYLSVVVPSPI